MCTLTFLFWERKLYFSTLPNNSFIIRSLDMRYNFYPAASLLLATARLLHNLLDRIVVEWVGWDFIQVSPKFHYIFHHPTAATSLIFTDQLSWVCLSLSVCLCVSMLSVVCHAYRNNLIRLRWLACSVRRRHPPPAADEQTFIINKEDYLIKPCSLQLSISLLVVTVVCAGDMNQMGTSCNLQWPNWPNTCRQAKCGLHWIEECQSS